MKHLALLSSCILLALSACNTSPKEASDFLFFTREDIPAHQILANPESIEFEDTFNDPLAYWLIQDSLVLVNNVPHNDNSLIEIFSLNTRKLILSLGKIGNGPDEFGGCECIVPSSQSPVFYIKDAGKSMFYVIDIDKTLKSKALAIRYKFHYNSTDIHPQTDICLLNEQKYAGYNMWYLNDSTFNNEVPEVQIYQTREQTTNVQSESFLSKYHYFVSDVNGANLIRTPDNRIWIAEKHQDRIRILDDSLRTLLRTIIGPDNYQLAYEEHKSNIPMPFITFKNEKTYLSYDAWTLDDQSLYFVYYHVNRQEFNPKELPISEVYCFDKVGNPTSYYSTDRCLVNLSVDSSGKYLYATSRTSSGDPVEFIRYKLKN